MRRTVLHSPILVTGNRGKIGRVVEATLKAHGHDVKGFDVLDGKDIRDIDTLRAETTGCAAVVHLATLMPDDSPEDVFAVNVLGAWNLLQASEAASVSRIVCFSSVNALGIFLGLRAPDYFPIDDLHPCYASNAYGMSKRLSEEMCRCFTGRTGIPTICLRPAAVWTDAEIQSYRSRWAEDPSAEWSPFWEYGCFIHVTDVAEAVLAALTCPDPGHAVLFLNALDIASASKTSRELAAHLYPNVTWRGGSEYDADPNRALIDMSRTQNILRWSPRIRWRSSDAAVAS